MAEPTPKAHQIDYSNFIYFHPKANGSNGRSVFIDPELIVRFCELVNVSVTGGQNLAKKIVDKLSSIAGGITSDSNINNAAQHRDHFIEERVYVTYTIRQADVTNKGSGVYITNIELAVKTEKHGGPGLRSVMFSGKAGRDWKTEPNTSSVLTTKIGAVGALPPNSHHETNVEDSANAFGGYLEKVDVKRLHNEYSLFYTPAYAIDGFGVWIGAEHKTNRENGTPKALAQLMQNTENQYWEQTTQRHCWYVFGHGAKHMLSALKHLDSTTDKPLARHHEFKFIDPKIPLGELKNALSQVGIELTQEMITLDKPSFDSKIHIIADPNNTYSDFPLTFEKNKKLAAIKNAAQQHYDKKSQNVYFVDIVKGLVSALNGGWI